MINDDCEHSSRNLDLGGGTLVTLALSGDIFSADPERLAMLLQFVAAMDTASAKDALTKKKVF